MKSSTLIQIVQMDCPLCDQHHSVEERKRPATTEIKGEIISYEEHFCFCCNVEEDEKEFETGNIVNENLLRARNAYRIKHGLMTSDEIVALRESYGLSQVDLARLMGWGEATISRYESKAIQDDAYDSMLRLIRDNPLQALAFMEKNADKFSASKHSNIKAKMLERLNAYGKEYLSRQSFESEYVLFKEPCDFNGQTVLNIDKLEVIISYFADKNRNLEKEKLLKLLWYADALSFKSNEKALTGLVYRKESLGARPVAHRNLLDLKNVSVQEETDRNYATSLRIYPNETLDYSILSAEENHILDIVSEKFLSYETGEIIDYMKKEKAYSQNSNGEIIPFSLAKEIRAF